MHLHPFDSSQSSSAQMRSALLLKDQRHISHGIFSLSVHCKLEFPSCARKQEMLVSTSSLHSILTDLRVGEALVLCSFASILFLRYSIVSYSKELIKCVRARIAVHLSRFASQKSAWQWQVSPPPSLGVEISCRSSLLPISHSITCTHFISLLPTRDSTSLEVFLPSSFHSFFEYSTFVSITLKR